MLGSHLIIMKTPAGRFKGYAWGSPNYHMMDWRGCNYHFRSVDGQPHRGYATVEECETFLRARFANERALWDWAERGEGTFMTAETFKRRVKDVDLPREPQTKVEG